MKINKVFSIFLLCTGVAYAADYQGRVVDIDGRGIGYATVYPEEDPVAGAATNDQGFFHFSTDLSDTSTVVVSFIGYEKQVLPLRVFTPCDSAVVVLREQPIALEETVVAAKANKQRNKRKQMAALLHQVYVRMQEDFSDEPSKYHVVSDARLDSEGEAWGMEQMIASVVVLPEARKNNKDSVQFAGEYCKRFFDPTIRKRVDTVFATRTLEKYDPRMRMAATDMLIGGLFDEPRNWKLWVAHLYETDNGVQAETIVATLDDYTLSDFCQHGDKIIKSLRETEENYFGYAFVAAPNERYDFDQGEERLLENFMHSGLLDKSLHLPEEELMVSRKDMVTLLLADRGRFDVTESHVRKVQKLVDKVDETDLDTSEVATRIQSVVNQEEDY